MFPYFFVDRIKCSTPDWKHEIETLVVCEGYILKKETIYSHSMANVMPMKNSSDSSYVWYKMRF